VESLGQNGNFEAQSFHDLAIFFARAVYFSLCIEDIIAILRVAAHTHPT
jgi:hypothetical protein